MSGKPTINAKKYTIGLDIGTNSVGWAVIDEDFNLVQGKKKINDNGKKRKSKTNLWGVRLFEEGDVASGRRLKRGARRRIARRKERLNYLRGIFEEEIYKVDDSFFVRLDESFYQLEDKKKNDYKYRDADGGLKTKEIENKEVFKYPLFRTGEEEKEYYKQFPTIYHLRKHLMENEESDIRKIYLGMHHILKYRGHFTNQGQEFDLSNINVAESLGEVLELFDSASPFYFGVVDKEQEKANEILTNKNLSKSAKAFRLNEYYEIDAEILYNPSNERYLDDYENLTDKQKEKFISVKQKQLKALFTGIVGNSIDLKSIFDNEEYKASEENELPKGSELKYSNENFDDLISKLDGVLEAEEIKVITSGKRVYEAIVLSGILTKEDLSSSMIESYNSHKEQLSELKKIAKSISDEFYADIFKEKGVYEKYIQGEGNPAKVSTREVFYSELKSKFEKEFKNLKFPQEGKDFDYEKVECSEELQTYLSKINHLMQFDNFLPKQRMSDNGAIPYQVHEHELLKIIERQAGIFPFLEEKIDLDSGAKENKIQKLFKFRIPYYVGTLAKEANWKNEEGTLLQTASESKNSWLVRKSEEKTTPWNFDKVIDKEASAINFIERMTNFDAYLPEEKVLPDKSLLYQEYKIFNELIISGYMQNRKRIYFDAEMRQSIFNDLFKQFKKVTTKKLIEYLNNVHLMNIQSQKELFGIDTFVKNASFNTSYSTYIDLKQAGIDEEKIEKNKEKFEEIIKWQTIFEDKKVLKKRIKTANESWQLLSEDEIKNLSKKHYTGWGRLSKKLIDGICADNGKTIIENLKNAENRNFMRLLEDEKIAEAIRKAQTKNQKENTLSYDLVESLAGSPAIKKGIWQSLKVISELEQVLGRENISRVVIEMSRENSQGRTKTRQKQIENFYKTFKEKTEEELSQDLKQEFASQTAEAFDNEKLFLYFLQNGRCMYSNDTLDLDSLNDYEVDHIVPQTFIKDDSFNNKVLVKKKANQDKGGDTPTEVIITRMKAFWTILLQNGQITKQKFMNLTTKSGTFTSMNDEKLEGFINRQLVENRQITKHVANILNKYFDGETEVLTPKSALTSQFRQGVVYIPKDDFDFENKSNYEFDGKYIGESGEILKESKYKNAKFVKFHYHKGFPKNRDINNYHHAHDAYLNAVVANFIYLTQPDLKEMLVYGKYKHKFQSKEGKYASQRKEFHLQLLNGMADEEWLIPETGQLLNGNLILCQIEKVLSYRDVNIVKKPELQLGKFGDESVYKKDEKANNFSVSLKEDMSPQKYGGTKAPISALTSIIRNKKGDIKPVSIPAISAQNYLNSKNKLEVLQTMYPKENIVEIVVNSVAKYSKYILPNGATRLLASYQEAQNGVDLPMIQIVNEHSSEEELITCFDNLAEFIAVNKLFSEKKIPLISNIRENFVNKDNIEKLAITQEMFRIVKGNNQHLKVLPKVGLGTTAQQLKLGNTITNDTILVQQSVTGLYETRITLE